MCPLCLGIEVLFRREEKHLLTAEYNRLRRTGVVNVENPVAQAYREGRLDNDVIDGKDRVEELD